MSIKLLVLRVTQRCNLNCDYCYASEGPKVHMTQGVAISAIERFSRPGEVLKIQFTGGEPLLNMPLIEAIYIYGIETKRQLLLSVQTNGTLLSKEICQKLKQMRVSIGVSLDGIGKANRLRTYPDGKSSFEDVLEGLQNLRTVGIKCNLTTVVTCDNVHSLDQILQLSAYLGHIHGVSLDFFRPLGRGKHKNLTANQLDLEAGIDKLINQYDELRRLHKRVAIKAMEKMERVISSDIKRAVYCYAQTDQSLCIDPEGNLYPCSSLSDSAHLIGNINSGLSMHQRDAHLMQLSEICSPCKILQYCMGGCPASDDKTANCILNRKLHQYLTNQRR
ncbi:radical SAM/SPASM domain-containing protein [Fusibacter sp. 3D3]|uniref:radical SAM/SPASM domain-containing protein n=1 Tax=Fusibacter sp. 3D3 TaxID=1048380 RepID=UPI0008538FC2|nr:radical SAM protein [Fusibacter sp. 3D3]GAU76153.1 radical SAM domain protein [Fusibacter sp. 3D3]